MTRSHFIEILMILTKYVFDLGVWLTEFPVTVESVTLRFYCSIFKEGILQQPTLAPGNSYLVPLGHLKTIKLAKAV